MKKDDTVDIYREIEKWKQEHDNRIWVNGTRAYQVGDQGNDTVLVLQDPPSDIVTAPLDECDSGKFVDCMLSYLRLSGNGTFTQYERRKLRLINLLPNHLRKVSWKDKIKCGNFVVENNEGEIRTLIRERHVVMFGRIAECLCHLRQLNVGFSKIVCPHPSARRQNVRIDVNRYMKKRMALYPELFPIPKKGIAMHDRNDLALRMADYIYLRRTCANKYDSQFCFSKFCSSFK